MLNAIPPYYSSDNPEKTYHKIRFDKLKFSDKVTTSDESKDLIVKVSFHSDF